MRSTRRFPILVLLCIAIVASSVASAPTDSPQDADTAQSGYVGGDHNIGPDTVSTFQHLWNITFKPDEKHYARPLIHTLATGKQIVFTASTENIVRSIDAVTGEILYERQVAPPWPMTGASCESVSKNMGIMGTPVIYPEYDVAFFFVKSYIEDYRVPGGATPPLNSVYYFYAIYLDGLGDVYKFPLFIDDAPADNDPRKIFLGGLVLQQPSLLAVGDVVYAGFGGLCDAFNYTGTLVAININTRTINRWATQGGPASPWTIDWTQHHGGGAGGIWQSGMGLATDGQDVYFSIDNDGTPDANTSRTPIPGKTPQASLSASAVRLTLNASSALHPVDFFRPSDHLSNAAHDIGSSGLSLLAPSAFNTTATPRLAVSTTRTAKLYLHNLDALGGFRTGANGSDAVLQTLPLAGPVFGGIASYPLEGGYLYVNPGGAGLAAYRFAADADADAGRAGTPVFFTLAGAASAAERHAAGGGIPTVTSRRGEAGSGIVWVTDVERGLLAYEAVPVNGTLVEIRLPRVEGAVRFGRPVFGDGRVYVVDGKDRLVALGVGGNATVSGR